MKKLIISLCTIVFLLFSCSDKDEDTDKFITQFIVKNNPVKVAKNAYNGIFNGYFVYTVKNLKRLNKNDWMVEYSSNIRKMVVLTSTPRPENMINNIVNDVLTFCKENGYEDSINIDGSGSSANLFFKSHNDKITGLMIISINSMSEDVKHLEVRCINGHFSSEDVKKIAAIHGSEKRKNIGVRINT